MQLGGIWLRRHGLAYWRALARGNGVRAFRKQLEIIDEALASEDWVDLLEEADPPMEERISVVVCQTAMAFAVVVFVVFIFVGGGGGLFCVFSPSVVRGVGCAC